MSSSRSKPGRSLIFRLAVALVIFAGVALSARAQTPAQPAAGSTASALPGSTASAPTPEGAIPLARLFDEADAALAVISSDLTAARTPLPELPDPEQVKQKISESRAKISRLAGLDVLTLTALNQEIDSWNQQAKQIEDASAGLGDRIQDLQKRKSDLTDLQSRWRRTNEAYAGSGIGETSQQRIDQVIEESGQAVAALEKAVPPLLDGQSRMSELRAAVREHLDFLNQRLQWLNRSTWEKDSPSLFETGVVGLFNRERFKQSDLAERWNEQLREADDHLSGNRGRLILLGAVLLLLWLWMRSLLLRLQKVTDEVPNAEELAVLFRHPLVVSVLLCGLAAPLVVTGAPLLLREAYLLVLLGPVLFLLIRLISERHLQYFIIGMGACYALGVTRDLLLGTPPLDRVLLIVQTGLGLAVSFVTLAPKGMHQQTAERGWNHLTRWIGLARWVLGGLLGLAMLGQIGGYTRLSQLVAQGTFGTVDLALLALVTYRLLRSLTVYFIYGPAARRLRGVKANAGQLTSSASRLLFCAAFLLWLYGVAVIWNADEVLQESLAQVWDLGFKVGETKITVALMVGAVLALYLSLKLSRALTFMLDQEVYPRRMTPPGLGQAVNQGIRYLMGFLGLVLALAVLGVRLQSLAIIAGALGVGIGFGLQNVVNNFVAGIIMLVERPIKLGDVVEMEGIYGLVRHIGIRATVIETWDQSEIIVPNGDLLWSKLINWTRTNGVNRVIVPAGVAYGTDPEQVLAILLAAAADHPEVLTTPAPAALFTGFGDSSLDFELRCYLPSIDGRLRVPSELRVAIYQALDEAGIEIPFPQRDLHIKTTPGAGPAAARQNEESQPPSQSIQSRGEDDGQSLS